MIEKEGQGQVCRNTSDPWEVGSWIDRRPSVERVDMANEGIREA